jgi:CheY-like chemotaxis protein
LGESIPRADFRFALQVRYWYYAVECATLQQCVFFTAGESDSMDTILIATSNICAAEALTATAESLGFLVLAAADGLEAYDCALAHKPLIAILDPGLDIYDGYEVAGMFRDSPDIKPAPETWLLTNLGVDARRLERCGIRGVISPGQAASDLRELMGTILRGR